MSTVIQTQKGAVMVEFAIVLPFLLLLTFGIIEFGNAIMQFNTLNKLTMDVARYLANKAQTSDGVYSLSGTDSDNNQTFQTNATRLITCGSASSCGSYSILASSPTLTFDSTHTRVGSTGQITVVASYTYQSIFSQLFNTNITLNNLSLTSTVVVQAL